MCNLSAKKVINNFFIMLWYNMPMAFTIYNLSKVFGAECYQDDSLAAIGSGVFDGIVIAMISGLAALVLANNATYIYLPGLVSVTNQTAYIFLGASGGMLVFDLVSLAVSLCQKSTRREEIFNAQENTDPQNPVIIDKLQDSQVEPNGLEPQKIERESAPKPPAQQALNQQSQVNVPQS